MLDIRNTHAVTQPVLFFFLFFFKLQVFQERPEIPPSQAQAQARNIAPEEYSYSASILRLLRNKSFMLLVVSYGGSCLVEACKAQ